MIGIRLKTTVLTLIAFVTTYGAAAMSDEPHQASVPNLVVQIEHMQLDLRPSGGTASTCLLVLPDLKIHTEKRIQHLGDHAATLSVSEATLTPDQMQQLRTILDAEQIKALPHFDFKREYVKDAGFEVYQARIVRDKRVQVVGYENPLSKTSSVPESVRNQWDSAQQALKPLQAWVDAITPQLVKRPIITVRG